jgi:hypothetical protein
MEKGEWEWKKHGQRECSGVTENTGGNAIGNEVQDVKMENGLRRTGRKNGSAL